VILEFDLFWDGSSVSACLARFLLGVLLGRSRRWREEPQVAPLHKKERKKILAPLQYTKI